MEHQQKKIKKNWQELQFKGKPFSCSTKLVKTKAGIKIVYDLESIDVTDIWSCSVNQ